MSVDFSSLNWLAVILASLSIFVLGGLWYGPLFGRAWMAAFGFAEEDLQQRKLAMVFSVAFLMAFIAALNLAVFIGPEATWVFSSSAGFMAGIGWVAPFLGILYLFEARSIKAYAINAGYCILSLTLMGLILGLMSFKNV